MSDIDTADALLGDDDGDDYDLPLDEEAKLLGDDDPDETVLSFQADPLDDEEDEDTHRDKFASERIQQEAEPQETSHSENVNNRDYKQRFNRGRGGNGRGRGRGGFKNGPNRIGEGKCYVNPSFLQAKKPVQSVQPSTYKPRNFEPKRRVINPPFVTQPRFQQQLQHQQLNNQAFVQPVNQNVWQAPQPQPHQPNQNYYEGTNQPLMQQQQYYQPPIQNPPHYQPQQSQYSYDAPQTSQNVYPTQTNTQIQNYNGNSNYPPQYGGTTQNQPHFQPPPQQNFQNPHFQPPVTHQPQHATQNTQNYYEPNPIHTMPQQNPIFNHPPSNPNPQSNNHSFNPPPRHSAPLLQRPPVCFTHEQGQFQLQSQRYQPQIVHQQPQHNTQQQQQSYYNPPRQEFHHTQFRPRTFRPHFNSYGHRGGYQGRNQYNNRQQYQQQPVKRHYNWREDQGEDGHKRRSWNDYKYQQNEEEQDTQEEYYEEAEEQVEEEPQGETEQGPFTKNPSPEIEEDEETRTYRLKIEEQKRKREEIFAEKERKRKLAILKKSGQVNDIPALQTTQQRCIKPAMARIAGNANPNLRVLTRADNDKVALLSTPTMKVTIKPGTAPTRSAAVDAGGKVKLTAGFLSTRKVLAKDDALLDTPVVVVRNLAATSTETHLRKMCTDIGHLQSLEISPKERHAKIRFKSVASAHAFYKKYQRYMLDLSMIQVDLVAE